MSGEPIRPTNFSKANPPKDVEKAARFAESIRDNTILPPEVKDALNKQPGFVSAILNSHKKQQPNFVSSVSHHDTTTVAPQQNQLPVSPDWTRTVTAQKSNERAPAL